MALNEFFQHDETDSFETSVSPQFVNMLLMLFYYFNTFKSRWHQCPTSCCYEKLWAKCVCFKHNFHALDPCRRLITAKVACRLHASGEQTRAMVALHRGFAYLTHRETQCHLRGYNSNFFTLTCLKILTLTTIFFSFYVFLFRTGTRMHAPHHVVGF